MLTVVTWRWRPKPGYRSTYAPETVRVLRNMVARHYPHPHRFVCVTDDATGLDDIDTVPIWDDFANVPSPHGESNPSCYRRLRAFHPEIGRVFGDRFVSLDLDTVIVGDLTPVWQRPEDFVIWGDTGPRSRYNGSMFLMSAGCRPQVWTDFDPTHSPDQAKSAGFWGSDQGWLSYRLGPDETKWSYADGVCSYRNHILPNNGALPAGARIVFLHGKNDPWDAHVRSRHAWLREHYQ